MTSERTYKQTLYMRIRLGKGGYCYVYNIIDGKKMIGAKSEGRKDRKAPLVITYKLCSRHGQEGPEFTTAKDFIAAYEATLLRLVS